MVFDFQGGCFSSVTMFFVVAQRFHNFGVFSFVDRFPLGSHSGSIFERITFLSQEKYSDFSLKRMDGMLDNSLTKWIGQCARH